MDSTVQPKGRRPGSPSGWTSHFWDCQNQTGSLESQGRSHTHAHAERLLFPSALEGGWPQEQRPPNLRRQLWVPRRWPCSLAVTWLKERAKPSTLRLFTWRTAARVRGRCERASEGCYGVCNACTRMPGVHKATEMPPWSPASLPPHLPLLVPSQDA